MYYAYNWLKLKGYAEITDRYTDIHGAFKCLLDDFNIKNNYVIHREVPL